MNEGLDAGGQAAKIVTPENFTTIQQGFSLERDGEIGLGTSFAFKVLSFGGKSNMAHVTHEIIVNAPVSTVFDYWKNFENFPSFMENIDSIESTGQDQTHWKMHGPLGASVEWDAETTYVEQNKKIAWKSTGGTIETHGAVLFEPVDDNRTRITVGLEYNPPGGPIGEAVAKLFNNPEQQLQEDLLRFKQFVQSGGLQPALAGTGAASGTVIV